MSDHRFNDQQHLTLQSYRTPDKLRARIHLHEQYTIPAINFTTWVLDHYAWRGDETVLDVGCGAGAYVNATRQRAGRLIAGDLSHGMLASLPQEALERVNLNAQTLPFPSASMDVVLANHMLYHVPDKAKAIAEIHRILKPGGVLLAATNSVDTMQELAQWKQEAANRLGLPELESFTKPAHSFALENGAALFEPLFAQVTRSDFPSQLRLPVLGPVMDYVASTDDWYEPQLGRQATWRAYMESVQTVLAEVLTEKGEIVIHKLSGVFVCRA